MRLIQLLVLHSASGSRGGGQNALDGVDLADSFSRPRVGIQAQLPRPHRRGFSLCQGRRNVCARQISNRCLRQHSRCPGRLAPVDGALAVDDQIPTPGTECCCRRMEARCISTPLQTNCDNLRALGLEAEDTQSVEAVVRSFRSGHPFRKLHDGKDSILAGDHHVAESLGDVPINRFCESFSSGARTRGNDVIVDFRLYSEAHLCPQRMNSRQSNETQLSPGNPVPQSALVRLIDLSSACACPSDASLLRD